VKERSMKKAKSPNELTSLARKVAALETKVGEQGVMIAHALSEIANLKASTVSPYEGALESR
jgi:hypothetical protein